MNKIWDVIVSIIPGVLEKVPLSKGVRTLISLVLAGVVGYLGYDRGLIPALYTNGLVGAFLLAAGYYAGEHKPTT